MAYDASRAEEREGAKDETKESMAEEDAVTGAEEAARA